MDIGIMVRVTPINHQGTVSSETTTILFPHLTVFTVQSGFLRTVRHSHASDYLTETDQFIVIYRISGHGSTVHMMHDGAVQ